MRTRWIRAADLPPKWDVLNIESGANPALDSVNILALRKHFPQNEEVWECYDDYNLVAATLLTGRALRQTYMPMNQPVCVWVQRPGYDFNELLAALVRDTGALMLSVLQLDPDRQKRPPDSAAMELIDYIETASVKVDGEFDDFWKSRGKLAANIKNRRNRLEKAGTKTTLKVVTSPLEIGKAVDEYGELESRGWKAKEGTAVRATNAQGRYYRELFEALARVGRASVWQYWYDDRLVASDLCVQGDAGMMIVLKTAYDEAESATAPSQLMRHEMFRQAWENGTERIEFYGRTMEWHRKWCTKFRWMYHANAFRWAWVRSLRSGLKRLRTTSPAGTAEPPRFQAG